ncbi:MAG: peptidylprolyl isomerase, partial [Spirochaetales bacterium]
MKIEKDKVVSLDYTLKDMKGEILDTTEGNEALEYLHGYENIIPGLEKELEGKQEGDVFSVVIDPADGYGEYSESLVIDVPRVNFDAESDIAIGMQFEVSDNVGRRVVKVVKIDGETVTIDANHEMAGQTLFFDIKVGSVRDASDEEKFSGDVGGGCGCSSGCNDS